MILARTPNMHHVRDAVWMSWPPIGREVFNDTFTQMQASHGVFHGSANIDKAAWREIAWKAAFTAANACVLKRAA